MVRGYQKRVIFVKNTGSELFDEAYFVLSERGSEKEKKTDMIKEANRIIDENAGLCRGRGKGRLGRAVRTVFCFLLAFILGAGTSLAVCLSIFI